MNKDSLEYKIFEEDLDSHFNEKELSYLYEAILSKEVHTILLEANTPPKYKGGEKDEKFFEKAMKKTDNVVKKGENLAKDYRTAKDYALNKVENFDKYFNNLKNKPTKDPNAFWYGAKKVLRYGFALAVAGIIPGGKLFTLVKFVVAFYVAKNLNKKDRSRVVNFFHNKISYLDEKIENESNSKKKFRYRQLRAETYRHLTQIEKVDRYNGYTKFNPNKDMHEDVDVTKLDKDDVQPVNDLIIKEEDYNKIVETYKDIISKFPLLGNKIEIIPFESGKENIKLFKVLPEFIGKQSFIKVIKRCKEEYRHLGYKLTYDENQNDYILISKMNIIHEALLEADDANFYDPTEGEVSDSPSESDPNDENLAKDDTPTENDNPPEDETNNEEENNNDENNDTSDGDEPPDTDFDSMDQTDNMEGDSSSDGMDTSSTDNPTPPGEEKPKNTSSIDFYDRLKLFDDFKELLDINKKLIQYLIKYEKKLTNEDEESKVKDTISILINEITKTVDQIDFLLDNYVPVIEIDKVQKIFKAVYKKTENFLLEYKKILKKTSDK